MVISPHARMQACRQAGMHMNNGASAHFMGDSDIFESSRLVGTSQVSVEFHHRTRGRPHTHVDIQTSK